ncbi:aldo/keto reductase [Streptomyces xantholiticus]|uniref:Aldo/keto reductase n=1 Tax=Streptomyces xantholiticus TaxID=68285 RepID=A0ABV1V3D6_9ACTN
MRRKLPRFAPENLAHNTALVGLRPFAEAHACTLAQLALAWLVAQGVVPIPGANCRVHMTDNAEADRVVLTAAELAEIDRLVPAGAFAGERFPEQLVAMVQKD